MHRQSPSTITLAAAAGSLALLSTVHGQYSATYYPSASGLPKTTENGQSGTNACGTGSSQTAQCQNFYINDINDWCVWGPPNGGAVADNERVEVAWCTQAGRGTRVIPPGTVSGAHFVKTPSYVQITGTGDFTKIGITAGDPGGELDPHGADGNGNPIGGLVFHNGQQMHEWFSFMSATDFCTRACFDGNRATSLCRHTYDELGCGFNAPGNYNPGAFESCQGNDAQDIMYGYPGLNSFQQADTTNGVQVPSAHPAPASWNCETVTGISSADVAYAGKAKAAKTTSSSSTSASSTTTSYTSSTSSSSLSTPLATMSKVAAPTISSASVASQDRSTTTSPSSSAATTQFKLGNILINLGLAAAAGLAFFL